MLNPWKFTGQAEVQYRPWNTVFYNDKRENKSPHEDRARK